MRPSRDVSDHSTLDAKPESRFSPALGSTLRWLRRLSLRAVREAAGAVLACEKSVQGRGGSDLPQQGRGHKLMGISPYDDF